MPETAESRNTISDDVLAEIKKEVVSQVAKWTIVVIIALFGLALSGWLFYIQAKIDEYIVARAGGIPVGSVVAVDLPTGCPSIGWEKFSAGAGRFILGEGAGGDSLTARTYRDRGHNESFRLTEANVPAHQHETVSAVSQAMPFGNGPSRNAVWGTTTAPYPVGMTSFWGKPTPDPVSIIPPFIVLHLCKKVA